MKKYTCSAVSVICDCVIAGAVSRSGFGDGADQLSLRSGLGAEAADCSLRSGLGAVAAHTLESSSLIVFALSLSIKSVLRIRPPALIVDSFVCSSSLELSKTATLASVQAGRADCFCFAV